MKAVQQVKTFGAKPNNLSSISRTHMERRGNQLQKLSSDLHIFHICTWHVHTHTKHTKNKIFKNSLQKMLKDSMLQLGKQFLNSFFPREPMESAHMPFPLQCEPLKWRYIPPSSPGHAPLANEMEIFITFIYSV